VFGFLHSASANKDWVDPIVRLTGRYPIDDKWFVNAEGDIGGPQQQRYRPNARRGWLQLDQVDFDEARLSRAL
jgi:hypothetical protein